MTSVAVAVAQREALLLAELGRSAEARAGLRHVVKELRRAGFSSGRVAGIEFASLASTSGRVVTDKGGRRRVAAPAPRRRDDKRRCAKQRRFELKWLQRRLRARRPWMARVGASRRYIYTRRYYIWYIYILQRVARRKQQRSAAAPVPGRAAC